MMMQCKCLITDPFCKWNCERCGWNPEEVEHRKKIFDGGSGLTVGSNGLKKLIIKREESEE